MHHDEGRVAAGRLCGDRRVRNRTTSTPSSKGTVYSVNGVKDSGQRTARPPGSMSQGSVDFGGSVRFASVAFNSASAFFLSTFPLSSFFLSSRLCSACVEINQ